MKEIISPYWDEEGRKKAQEAIQTSLGLLNNSNSKSDQKIRNQVKAFAYFQAGRLNDNQNNSQENLPVNYYKLAFDALKESEFNPYSLDIETDVGANNLLTEEDVKNIHDKLIAASGIDRNSSHEVAISFREYLYDGLDFFLKKDLLKQADLRTSEIVRYSNCVASLEDLSCPALREIDARWYAYPKRPQHFGFNVQKEIWQEVGSPNVNSPITSLRKFYIKLGWKTEASGIETNVGYVEYDDLSGFEDLKNSNKGNLPYTIWNGSPSGLASNYE